MYVYGKPVKLFLCVCMRVPTVTAQSLQCKYYYKNRVAMFLTLTRGFFKLIKLPSKV